MTPVGSLGGDSNIFPVVALDADSCVIDVSTPFELGEYLSRIEIVSPRNLLRRCAASVVELVPWCTPEGGRRFECKLRLSESHTDGSELLETVHEPARVRRVLEFAAMSNVQGWFESPGMDRGELRFLEAERDALSLVLYPARPPSSSRFIKLGFALFGVDYECSVRVLQEAPTHVRTAFPLNLRRGRAFQRQHRIARTGHDLRVSFRNPVSGTTSEHTVITVSSQQLSCEIVSESELLWDGMPLDEAYLSSPEHQIRLGEVRVEGLAPYRAVRQMNLKISDPRTRAELTQFLSSAVHPAVSLHDGENFRGMLGIYKEAGLFAPHMRENLEPIVTQAKRVWHTMHQPRVDVIQTFVHGPPAAPDGAGSVLRAWDRGWVAQHVVSVSQQFNGAAGHVMNAMVDFLVREQDGQNMVFFVKSDNRGMNAFLERFLATTGSSEIGERRNLGFWRRSGDQPELPQLQTGCRVHVLRENQERMVQHAAQRVLGAHGSAALSFTPGELGIPEASRRFAALDLVRERVSSIISAKRGTPLWAVVEEITSLGVNFTWMLNACWLFPIHGAVAENDMGLRTALRHIIEKPKQSPTGDTFVNSAGPIDEQLMAETGFEKLADIYMYTLNRTGIHRLYYYLADRYGEVDARTQQRQARRSGIRLKSGESLTSLVPKSRAG
ncbi:MAG TPA: hypothetical protein VJR89_07620 [Polyangiales bacterium]|nr:hypothetical protein [Polyangiales bacterium]